MCDSCCEAPIPTELPSPFCPQCWNIPCSCTPEAKAKAAVALADEIAQPRPMTGLPLPEAVPGQTVARGIALMHNVVVASYNALLADHEALRKEMQVLQARFDTHCRNADAQDNGHT